MEKVDVDFLNNQRQKKILSHFFEGQDRIKNIAALAKVRWRPLSISRVDIRFYASKVKPCKKNKTAMMETGNFSSILSMQIGNLFVHMVESFMSVKIIMRQKQVETNFCAHIDTITFISK